MAIYHHSVSIVKRSAGKSSVAAAAYRSGQKLTDERTGIIHDYTKKIGVNYSVILTPIAADWIADRQQLWNKIEATEKRYDARLSREVSLALPCELDRDHQIALVHEYVKENYVNRGMIADVNFHNLESNNPHVHIMLSLRRLEIDEHGQVFFGNKNREWDSRTSLLEQRRNWEVMANEFLADAGYNRVRIDCRSLEAQGIDRVPQIHLGFHAASMRAIGKSTRIGDEYDRIEAENNIIKLQLEEIYNDRSAITDLDRECERLHQQISDLQAEINQGTLILARIAQEKSDKNPKFLTSEKLIEMIGGDDRVKRIAQWCRQNLLIPDGQTEFKRESNSITTQLSAINIDPLSVAYIFTDTVRQDKLTINCCKTSGEIVSLTGVVTGAVMNLISTLDNQMLMQNLRKLSKTKTQAEPEIGKVQEQVEKIQAQIPRDPVSIPEAEKIQAQIPPDPVTKNDRRVISRRRSNERE